MEDYSVLEAADAAQCRKLLSENDVDLVILDIMLPDGDGISLCREIKAKYDIPILFLSALSENDDIITALRAGGDDYLPKPYDIQVLIARVEARLRSVRKDKRYISFGRLRLDTVSMAAYFAENDLLYPERVLDSAYACPQYRQYRAESRTVRKRVGSAVFRQRKCAVHGGFTAQ